MIYPADAPLGQGFGADPATYAQFGMSGHNGQDFPVSVGTSVVAPEDGEVIISGNNVQDQYTGAPVGGETVVIRGKYEHWLLHNSQRLVSAGQKVRQGQVVAYSGNTGFTTGPHCHWGTRPLNPDITNGYRGFIDPLTIKEDDMPNAGDVDNAYLAANGRVATDKEKQDYTTKDWGAEGGLYYGKILVDMRNIRKALETSSNNVGAAAKLEQIKQIVGS